MKNIRPLAQSTSERSNLGYNTSNNGRHLVSARTHSQPAKQKSGLSHTVYCIIVKVPKLRAVLIDQIFPDFSRFCLIFFEEKHRKNRKYFQTFGNRYTSKYSFCLGAVLNTSSCPRPLQGQHFPPSKGTVVNSQHSVQVKLLEFGMFPSRPQNIWNAS